MKKNHEILFYQLMQRKHLTPFKNPDKNPETKEKKKNDKTGTRGKLLQLEKKDLPKTHS